MSDQTAKHTEALTVALTTEKPNAPSPARDELSDKSLEDVCGGRKPHPGHDRGN
jgi:hypothetical protein